MSKYLEDIQFENYGKEPHGECTLCEKLKKKLERKVGLKQNTIDNLERELKYLKEHHWKLVEENCILRDKLTDKSKALRKTISLI